MARFWRFDYGPNTGETYRSNERGRLTSSRQSIRTSGRPRSRIRTGSRPRRRTRSSPRGRHIPIRTHCESGRFEPRSTSRGYRAHPPWRIEAIRNGRRSSRSLRIVVDHASDSHACGDDGDPSRIGLSNGRASPKTGAGRATDRTRRGDTRRGLYRPGDPDGTRSRPRPQVVSSDARGGGAIARVDGLSGK